MEPEARQPAVEPQASGTPGAPSTAPSGVRAARPAPTPKPGNLLMIAILSLAAGVVGVLIVLFAGGDALSSFLGLCCGAGGFLLFGFSLLAYRSLRQRAVLASASPPSGAIAVPETEEWVCGACGADLRQDAKFCAKCGEPVEE